MRQGIVLKKKLADGYPVYGLIHGLASPAAAELAALAGYDIVIIDDEHAAGGRSAHLGLVQAIAAGGAASVLRLASQDPVAIGQALDLGVDGVMAPGIQTAKEAADFVQACRYPPEGTRGYGLGVARASGYGLHAAGYGENAGVGLFLCVIIESQQGAAQARAISAVQGIDAVIVGLQDLAADMGLPGNITHPKVQQALAEVEAAVLGEKKILGTAVHPGGGVEELVGRGHRFVTMGADTRLLGAAMQKQLENCPRSRMA